MINQRVTVTPISTSSSSSLISGPVPSPQEGQELEIWDMDDKEKMQPKRERHNEPE